MTVVKYQDAGVNIAAGNEAVKRIKPLVKQTFSPYVCTDIGAFASLFDLKALLTDYEHPLLVQSIDGVGTKASVAGMMQKFDTLGMDLVSATANDIIVMGAKPLTLLDYIATEKLYPEIVEQIIQGMSQACIADGISLVGGETAEMPGTYRNQEHDLVGVVTGVVDKKNLIMGQNIRPGDLIYGLASSGLHTNGYSLARKLFFEVAKYKADTFHADLNSTVGECLLTPHKSYVKPVRRCLDEGIEIKGMAHITGGGFLENIPRILPENCQAYIQKRSWLIPSVFTILKELGQLDDQELFHTFNMGIGLVMIIDESMSSKLHDVFASMSHQQLYLIGEVQQGTSSDVRIV